MHAELEVTHQDGLSSTRQHQLLCVHIFKCRHSDTHMRIPTLPAETPSPDVSTNYSHQACVVLEELEKSLTAAGSDKRFLVQVCAGVCLGAREYGSVLRLSSPPDPPNLGS